MQHISFAFGDVSTVLAVQHLLGRENGTGTQTKFPNEPTALTLRFLSMCTVHCASVSDTNRVLKSEAAILRTAQSVFLPS